MTAQRVPFHKYSACGNDFILIDHRDPFFPVENLDLIRRLCDRRRGIGADGLILLENSSNADYRLRIFNADGSEAEMCGNGLRCLLPFLHSLGVSGTRFQIETMHRVLGIAEEGDCIAVDMGLASGLRWDLAIPVQNLLVTGHYMNTGVPHVVVFVDMLDAINVAVIGREIRNHALFSPRGTNANFVSRCADGYAIRTYERGVEAETLACGTGATAAALAIAKTTGAASPIKLRTRSGDMLQVSFRREGDHFHDLQLSGPAEDIYCGEFSLFKDTAMGYDNAQIPVK